MTLLVILTVLVIVLLIAGLAFYLYWAGTLLDRIGAKLEGAADIVRGIVADAKLIGPGVEHINETGGVVAGALPLLYGMAEGIVAGVTPTPAPPEVPEVARPASGTRLRWREAADDLLRHAVQQWQRTRHHATNPVDVRHARPDDLGVVVEVADEVRRLLQVRRDPVQQAADPEEGERQAAGEHADRDDGQDY